VSRPWSCFASVLWSKIALTSGDQQPTRRKSSARKSLDRSSAGRKPRNREHSPTKPHGQKSSTNRSRSRLTYLCVSTQFFSPHKTIEVVEKVKHLFMNRLHWFTGPISPACDQYIQYLLVGTNPSVLNQHRWRLKPWRCQLSTSLSLSFPTSSHLVSPNGPACSPIKHPHVNCTNNRCIKTYNR
jgi:hypothetical protein